MRLSKLFGGSRESQTYNDSVTGAGDLSLLSRVKLLEMARSYEWVHSIDLGDGQVTAGQWGKGNPEITRGVETINFSGKSVLDIGCWDGQWTFEAEDRGASEIVSTDLITQRDFGQCRTFEVAAALRRSKARYMPNMSVYDVEHIGQKFDVVLYMGVIYHLKDPLRSLTTLRRVMNPGGVMLFESAVLGDAGCFAKFYYRDQFCGDRTNWWVPTRDCLKQWIECSFFRVRWESAPWGHGDNQRHCLVAEAIQHRDLFYARTPEQLEEYWR